MCATLLDPNQPNHYFTASPVRAHEHQIRAPEKGTLGGMSRAPYPGNVTVYPYNRYIRGTNPIVRCVMSLTCTPAQVPANPHAQEHAATQPLHHPSRVHAGRGLSSWQGIYTFAKRAGMFAKRAPTFAKKAGMFAKRASTFAK